MKRSKRAKFANSLQSQSDNSKRKNKKRRNIYICNQTHTHTHPYTHPPFNRACSAFLYLLILYTKIYRLHIKCTKQERLSKHVYFIHTTIGKTTTTSSTKSSAAAAPPPSPKTTHIHSVCVCMDTGVEQQRQLAWLFTRTHYVLDLPLPLSLCMLFGQNNNNCIGEMNTLTSINHNSSGVWLVYCARN